MCFGSKDNEADAVPPRPVHASASANDTSKVPYRATPPPQKQQQQQHTLLSGQPSAVPVAMPAAADEYAPPAGPPPSHAGPSYEAPSGPPPSRTAAPDYTAPAGPPPSHTATASDYAPPAGPPPSHRTAEAAPADEYAPPPGPPPSSQTAVADYATPLGPPPSRAAASDYTAPAGPPPSHTTTTSDYAPPAGPPPSSPPQHDWQTAVPDTALLPPPPALFAGWDRSPAHNATEQEAEAGEAWCEAHPLSATPLALATDAAAARALAAHNIGLMQPSDFQGTLEWVRPGLWRGWTATSPSSPSSPDTCLLGYPPLYAPSVHSPLVTGRPYTAYYEVKVADTPSNNSGEITLAMGVAALPYPAFRLPGWHRGSLAVHGDDGHRYVNDMWGGKSFTTPFRRGEVYGLGMRFTAAASGGTGGIDVEIFFTRNGRVDGRWDLHEETDAEQDRSVAGLEGYHDLSIAIGTFDSVGFEVRFDPALWVYKPEE